MKIKICDKNPGKIGIVLALIVIFGILLFNAFAEEEKTRISELEKEDLSDEDNEALKEYYGQVFGIIGENSRFNDIATKENIAIINVTIDGRDRRIITKLATGVVLPKIADKLVAALLQADNVTVFDYLNVLGKTIFSSITSFGERRFYGVESSEAIYVNEGFSRLADGKANVSVNPVLRELISKYNVYLSAEGMTRGIYVAEKSSSYFVVRSVNAGSNVGFSWMLRGIKKEADGKFESVYAERLGIGITATINSENGTTAIRVEGLDKILKLVGRYNNQTTNNITGNETNQNAQTSSGARTEFGIPQGDTNSAGNNSIDDSNEANNGQGIQLITGNLVDEFGLETDLGRILSDTPQTLPEIGNIESDQGVLEQSSVPTPSAINDVPTSSSQINNNADYSILNDAINNIPANESLANETYALEFTLFSVDEDLIVNGISIVTGLRVDDARKLVNFVYSDPLGFEDEIVEQATGKIDGIEKVNGSVIIRLG